MVYRCRYHYSFAQKVVFLSLWCLGTLFVLVNFLSNPILSVSSSLPTLSIALATVQILLLVTLWYLFINALCSMGSILRWFAAGVVVLPYVAQVGLLSYQVL